MNLGFSCPKLSRIMLWFFNSVWILPFCMGGVVSVVENDPRPTINWHRTNPLWKEGGAKLSISLSSNLVIECPTSQQPLEYYRIVWVTEEEFKQCTDMDGFKPPGEVRLLLNCNLPSRPLNFVQQISTFSSVPNVRDGFEVGKNYYITTFSTSSEKGLFNEYKGACSEFNMKLNITVTKAPDPPTQAPTNHTKTTQWTPKPTPRPTQTTHGRTTTTTTTPRPTQRPTARPTTTKRPRPTDIPDPTDIIINVPPGNGNTATIVADSAHSLTSSSWALALCLCLSLLHILNIAHIPWTSLR